MGVRLLLCSGFYPKLLGYQAASCSLSRNANTNCKQNLGSEEWVSLCATAFPKPWHAPSRGANPKVPPSACKPRQCCRDLCWIISCWNGRRPSAWVWFVNLESYQEVEISEKFGVWVGRTGFFHWEPNYCSANCKVSNQEEWVVLNCSAEQWFFWETKQQQPERKPQQTK